MRYMANTPIRGIGGWLIFSKLKIDDFLNASLKASHVYCKCYKIRPFAAETSNTSKDAHQIRNTQLNKIAHNLPDSSITVASETLDGMFGEYAVQNTETLKVGNVFLLTCVTFQF